MLTISGLGSALVYLLNFLQRYLSYLNRDTHTLHYGINQIGSQYFTRDEGCVVLEPIPIRLKSFFSVEIYDTGPGEHEGILKLALFVVFAVSLKVDLEMCFFICQQHYARHVATEESSEVGLWFSSGTVQQIC